MQLPVQMVIASSGILYYNNAMADGDWNTLGNWWEDAGFTTPSTTIPDMTNAVEIYDTVSTNSGSAAQAMSAVIHNTSVFSIPLTATGNIDFYDTASNAGSIQSTSGLIDFYNSTSNTGTITASQISWHNTATNTGSIVGNTHFYDTATFSSGTIDGDAIFDGNNNGGTVNGDAVFNNSAINAGTVNGDATFTGSSYDGGVQMGSITGTITFSSSVNFSLSPSTHWTTDTSSWIFQGIPSWTFATSSDNTGIISGSASFANGSNNNGTINGNASFYDTTVNSGSVGGNASFYDASTNTGSVNTLVNHRNTNTSSVNMGGSFIHLVAYDASTNDQNVAGNITLYNSATNTAIITGNADLYGTSNNSGTINGIMGIHDGRGLSIFGGVYDNVALYDACYNDITTPGNANFYGNSYNASVVSGDGYFYNNSYNNSSVNGQGFFYQTAYNDGTVTLDATFTNSSHNNTTITGNATLIGMSYNAGTIGGVGSFSGQSYNIGTVTGNATFVDTSYNSPSGPGIISGDASYGCFAANLGTVTGIASYIPCGSAPTGDLLSTDDTGASTTDNITKLTTLRMTGTCDTSLVTLFVDGVNIGDATNYDVECPTPGATYQISTSPAIGTLTEGLHSITTVRSNALSILYGASPISSAVSFIVDTTAPTLTINQKTGQSDPTNNTTLRFTVVGSESLDPATFTTSDITLSGIGSGTVSSVNQINATTFEVTVTGATDGTISASIGTNKIADIAGNMNTLAATSTDNAITLDTTAPTVTLSRAIGQGPITSSSTLYFSAVFSESINPSSFTSADITLSGTGTGTVGTVTNPSADGITWTIPVSATALGTFIVHINTTLYADPAGNINTTSTLSSSIEFVAGGGGSSNNTPQNQTGGGNFSVSVPTAVLAKTVTKKNPLLTKKTTPTVTNTTPTETSDTVAPVELNSAPEGDTSSAVTSESNQSVTIETTDIKRYTPINYDTNSYNILSEKYGSRITPDLYENQCVTNHGKSYFRICSQGKNFDAEKDFVANALCEGFILPIPAGESYEGTTLIPRKEVLDTAVKMRTRKITPPSITPRHSFTDIDESWVDILVTRALGYAMITQNKEFAPNRTVSRSEAYSMIMRSVCMPVVTVKNKDWTYGVYTTAKYMGMTQSSSYGGFRATEPISRTEMIVIASRAADWAEDTGGCNPKPDYCFLDD